MTKGHLEIHSENILPIIKKWLYSDKDIFVRELVSNACDAIHKVKILADQGKVQLSDDEFKVDISIDKDKKTLTFSDNGIGMTKEEVKEYIAQIAFSGAEKFIEHYKTNKEEDQFIGHFGLGFYSAYMVADSVTIDTLSYQEGAKAALWKCDGSSEYELSEGKRDKRGTTITLHIGKDNEEYLDKTKVRSILRHYCSFLPYPIYLEGEKINDHEPLWIKNPSECKKDDYLAFYRYLYPLQEDPIFWIHLNVDYPFHVKGILYFPKIKPNFQIDKQTVQLYCNRVFVADNCKDIIPQYLQALQGVIDSPDIPLNVSRSYLQMDRTVRQLSSHISKKVADSLSKLYTTEKDRFISSWNDLSIIVKLGAMEDAKFYERVKNILIWKNTDGEWTTVEDYLERNKDKTNNKVFYTNDESHAKQILEIYKKKGIEVLIANSPIDHYLISFLESKIHPATFKRIDASIDDALIDKEREKTVLDAQGKTAASKIADFIKRKLKKDKVNVEAKSLSDDNIPGFLVIDEHQRRMRDTMRTMNPQAPSDIGPSTFVVNTNNPLISSLEKLNSIDPKLSEEIINHIYELSLLSQREMNPEDIHSFISRSSHVLQDLVEKMVETKKKSDK